MSGFVSADAVPLLAVSWLCLWEEVGSGYSCAVLVGLLVVFIFEIIVTVVYPRDTFPHTGLPKQCS